MEQETVRLEMEMERRSGDELMHLYLSGDAPLLNVAQRFLATSTGCGNG